MRRWLTAFAAVVVLAGCDSRGPATPVDAPATTASTAGPVTTLPAGSASCALVDASVVSGLLGVAVVAGDYGGPGAGCLFRSADGTVAVAVTLLSGTSASGLTAADMVANARNVAGSSSIDGVDGVDVQGGPVIAASGDRGVSVTVTGISGDREPAVAILRAALAGLTP